MNRPGLTRHVIHEEILAEVVRSREVSLTFAHLRNFLDEIDERVVAGEHECIDHNAGALAFVYLFERFANDERIKAERILVNAVVFERECGGFSVSDHYDLTLVFALAKEDALRDA